MREGFVKFYALGIASACLVLAACGQNSGGGAQGNDTGAAAGAVASAQDISAEMANGNFGRAAELARAAVQAQPGNAEILLILARAEARLNNVGYAVDALDKAFANGFHDPRGAVRHPDFDKIRTTPAFRNLLKNWNLASGSGGGGSSSGAADSGPSSLTRAGDVSITETGSGTRIQAGDVVIED